MSRYTLPVPLIVDQEAFQDFVDSITDSAPNIEREVAKLKKAPEDRTVVAELFRAVHNIKGDAALCKFKLASDIAHPIESLLSRLRDGSIQFSELLGEVVLLAVDRLELVVDALANGRNIDNLQIEALIDGLDALSEAGIDTFSQRAVDVIQAVTGFRPVTLAAPQGVRPQQLPFAHREVNAADLGFFRLLALQYESRSPLYKGRTGRLLRLAEETNDAAGRPIDPEQLEAAIYMHDVGMMLLPETVWLKVGKLSDADKALLHKHPHFGAEILRRIPGWEAAAEMVAQHHEMPDGTGYPGRLKAPDICAGAKVLAIVDAFEAVMLKHSHRGHGKSTLRAIAEVNASLNQFAEEWVAPFNSVIRRQIEVA